MAIKAKFIECECGALFQEENNQIIKGEFSAEQWTGKSSENSHSFCIKFTRNIRCTTCDKKLLTQEKSYQISSPKDNEDGEITKSSSINYIY